MKLREPIFIANFKHDIVALKNLYRVTERTGRVLTQHFVAATCCRFLKALLPDLCVLR